MWRWAVCRQAVGSRGIGSPESGRASAAWPRQLRWDPSTQKPCRSCCLRSPPSTTAQSPIMALEYGSQGLLSHSPFSISPALPLAVLFRWAHSLVHRVKEDGRAKAGFWGTTCDNLNENPGISLTKYRRCVEGRRVARCKS